MTSSKTKRIGMILSALSLLAGLTACGGDAPIPSNPTSSSDTAVTNAEERPWMKGLDFGGRTFIITNPNDNPGPTRGESEIADLQLDQIELVESTYNCKIKWEPLPKDGYYDRFVSAGAAGEYVADIVYADNRQIYPGWVKTGLLVCLDDYEGIFDYEDNMWNKSIFNYMNWEGKHYAFSTLTFDNYNDLGDGMYFNKDLFDAYNLTSPYEYYRNDTWTWDTMIELAEALTQDTDGDGENDQWGLSLVENYFPFLFSNGATLMEEDANGKWVYTLNSPKAIEAFEFYADLSSKGLATPWNGDEKRDRIDPFVQGKVGMMPSNIARLGNTLAPQMADNYSYGWVPFPKGPSADEYCLYRNSTSLYVIPSTVENPEQVMQMYVLIEDYNHNENVDGLALCKGRYLCDDESLEILRDAYEGGWNKYDMSRMVDGFLDLSRSAADNFLSGAVSAKAATDAIADTAQKLIDDTFNAN